MVKYIDTRLLQGQEKLYAGENDPVYAIDENIINDLPAAKVIEIDFVRNYLLNLIEHCKNSDSAQIKEYLQKTLDDLEEYSEEEIDETPSQEYKKVIRAHWIRGCGYKTCSNCKNEHPLRDDMGYTIEDSYCPNCGATMVDEY